MTKRRLMSVQDAAPATEQHVKPCSDCPWARTASHGWLGGSTPEDWVADAHGDGIIECHTLIGAQCAGSAIYRSNVGKRPRNSDALLLPPDRTIVFASPVQFTEHHTINPAEVMRGEE